LHIITKSLAKPSIACVIWRDLACSDYAYGDIYSKMEVILAAIASITSFI